MKSMTGYGKSEFKSDEYEVTVEVKSVNNRYLDIVIKMSKEYNALEISLKKIAKDYLNRGRIDCFITINKEANLSKDVKINWHLLDQLVTEFNQAKKERYKDQEFSVSQLLSGTLLNQELISFVDNKEADGALEMDLLRVFEEAISDLDRSRSLEGNGIRTYLLQYNSEMQTAISVIKKEAILIEENHQSKLKKKLTDLVGDQIDQTRILTEVALMIERGDINEELDRLSLHIIKLNQLIEEKGSVGKEMDFIIQEMNREVNTIGSKSSHMVIKEQVVYLKTILEKIREQVQNIE